jgi:hypothetical protein
MKSFAWEALGKVSPRQLVEARLVLHHAAQLVAAVGRCLLSPRPDDGHTSLEWRAGARALAGQEVAGPRPWRAALGIDDLCLAVLARWVADGDALLRAFADTWLVASPVRLWPHHFDVGSMLPLDERRKDASSIGVGLSLGDEGIPEPYLYVTRWPGPVGESLPDLPAGGRWHRAGWTGAVLTGSDIVDAGDGAAQAAEAGAFLTGTVEVLRDWLGRRSS